MSDLYLPDANMFIEPAKGYYALDIMPVYWTWLGSAMGDYLVTVKPVIGEILEGGGALANWVKSHKSESWIEGVDDAVTQDVFGQIVNDLNQSIWCQKDGACKKGNRCQLGNRCSVKGLYTRHAVDRFLSGADPWLIARAKVLNATVVTFEVRKNQTKSKVPIPNVCRKYGVECINPFQLLRRKQVTFDGGKW